MNQKESQEIRKERDRETSKERKEQRKEKHTGIWRGKEEMNWKGMRMGWKENKRNKEQDKGGYNERRKKQGNIEKENMNEEIMKS